eukprot:12967453-Alexandrium_andersonii.AAC.1
MCIRDRSPGAPSHARADIASERAVDPPRPACGRARSSATVASPAPSAACGSGDRLPPPCKAEAPDQA